MNVKRTIFLLPTSSIPTLWSLLILLSFSAQAVSAPIISGEQQLWHSITLTFDGPEVSETDSFNPFENYRLNVAFTHKITGKNYIVPGYFAADGQSQDTSAVKGNKWRVHFSPDELGEWVWQADFRKGNFVAVSKKKQAGFSGQYMDGEKGTLSIAMSNKKAPDFRSKGRLQYINQPYLRFAGNGEYFIKAGPDAPENLLAYADFDGTFHNDGFKDNLVKTWESHVSDWQKGDPSWRDGKGKALIGALNYLSSKGMNSISFLTLNIMGDDQNVFPYIDYSTYNRFDVSKLAQWNVVFSHAQAKGLFLHFKTQEVENQGLLDNGGLGLHRQLYYRELIARFGHHLALNWNMGEENGEWYPNHITPPQNTIQRLAMAKYFHDNDPYNHHVVIHNGNDYIDLTGDDSYYTGASLQTHRDDFGAVHGATKRLRKWPVSNGRPMAVSVDEPGDAEHSLVPDDVDPEHNSARINGLWGALTAGAWGTEWYFGYAHPHSDLTAQNWRTRELFWNQAKHALDFFANSDVPYHKASNFDELVNNNTNAWVLAELGEFYIVYIKDASKAVTLKMQKQPASYSVRWFDPRNGGKFQKGSITDITLNEEATEYWQKAEKDIGKPPVKNDKDWVVLIKKL